MLLGAGLIVIALLALNEQAKIEGELAQYPAEVRAYWKPALEQPELIKPKMQELLNTA